jgi:hypothetical protein
MTRKQVFKRAIFALCAATGVAFSQPTPAPTTADAACGSVPAANPSDTVVSTPNSEGFYSLFNGKDFTGWWQSCNTGHSSSDPAKGAIFRVDAERKAIYTTQRGTNVGGILMTKKKFLNYEIAFELWPDFFNDGGLFNRTTDKGNCFQTVLDYINGASLGGTWGEGGFTSRDNRPFTFGDQENLNISISSGESDPNKNWTAFTAKQNPTKYGCPATGCVAADWNRLWDKDNWNQMRIKFYGGTTANRAIHMMSYFRKTSTDTWVPIEFDTTLSQIVAENFIGLQVHGGGRFKGPKGTWWRNLYIRPLDDKGVALSGPEAPAYTPGENTSSLRQMDGSRDIHYQLEASKDALIGSLDMSHEFTVRDVRGTILDVFHGEAGAFRYAFTQNVKGVLFVAMKTSRGITNFRVTRLTN